MSHQGLALVEIDWLLRTVAQPLDQDQSHDGSISRQVELPNQLKKVQLRRKIWQANRLEHTRVVGKPRVHPSFLVFSQSPEVELDLHSLQTSWPVGSQTELRGYLGRGVLMRVLDLPFCDGKVYVLTFLFGWKLLEHIRIDCHLFI